jgi:hypothetical protein
MPVQLARQPLHVANEAALLALSMSQMLIGDIVINDETTTAYILMAEDPSDLQSWYPFTGGPGGGDVSQAEFDALTASLAAEVAARAAAVSAEASSRAASDALLLSKPVKRALTSADTAAFNDDIVADTTGGPFALALPAAANVVTQIVVTNVGPNVLTLTGTVSGIVNPTLAQWSSRTIRSTSSILYFV